MKTKIILNTIVASLLIIGCGSDSTEENNQTTVKTAYYIDAPIQNVNYVCGSQNGVTGSDGSFKYEDGSTCYFNIGNIKLKSVSSELINANPKLFENNITIAQFLQSLDADNNISNGINITEEEKEILKDYNEIKPDDIPAIINEISTKTDLNLSVVDINTTINNLQNSLSSELKSILKSQIFYMPKFDKNTNKIVLNKIKIDENATKFIITDYNGIETNNSLSFEGPIIKITDDSNNTTSYTFNEYNEKFITLSTNNEYIKLFFNEKDAKEYINNINNSTTGVYGGILFYSDYNTKSPIRSGYIKFTINNNTGTVTIYHGSQTLSKNFDINYSNYYPINIPEWKVGNVSYSLIASFSDFNQTVSGWIDVNDNNGYVIYFYNFTAGK